MTRLSNRPSSDSFHNGPLRLPRLQPRKVVDTKGVIQDDLPLPSLRGDTGGINGSIRYVFILTLLFHTVILLINPNNIYSFVVTDLIKYIYSLLLLGNRTSRPELPQTPQCERRRNDGFLFCRHQTDVRESRNRSK